MTFADNVLRFYKNLRIDALLPENVVVLNPYQDQTSYPYCEQFYKKFYSDTFERRLILGINPGRYGGGVTGIPFTDPLKLEHNCNIPNPFAKKSELSADFIYTMINAFGGPHAFYGKFYFSAMSPLGFTKDGKNLNYYDLKDLRISLKNFIVDSLQQQLSFGIDRTVCFCLGEGENFKYLKQLNDELRLFGKIIPMAHPRFIMQYRRKQLSEYVNGYLSRLNSSFN